MTITIKYQDGSKRIINPTDEINKVVKGEPSLSKKIEDIAYSTGRPYTIVAKDGDKVVFSKTDNANKPLDH